MCGGGMAGPDGKGVEMPSFLLAAMLNGRYCALTAVVYADAQATLEPELVAVEGADWAGTGLLTGTFKKARGKIVAAYLAQGC